MESQRWQQIEELYNAALACEPAQRSVLLERADPDLRREVALMLAQKGSLLDRPAWESLQDSTVTMLAAGKRLGRYEIETPLGAGGMGEVFRARDTRLNRTVALKVSKIQFGERFEREARAIAQLNHSHICTLYDVGPNYLVMELVEGTTLSARIAKGALPMAEVLRYGAQIAEALAAAHHKGIVHRDLKPGNIMLAKSGVKVLDFGLAKSQSDDTLTAIDAVMGTPAYMAPEQRDGKPCDGGADIYALGIVIYEMATGRRPQPGEQCDLLPEKLAHAVRRCLAQDPEERWQSARDLKTEIEWAAEDTRGETPALSRGRNGRPWLIPTAVAIMVLLALALVYLRKPAADGGAISATIPPPDKTSFDLEARVSLSPDGTRLVFSATGEDGKSQLWLRPLDGTEAQPLPGTSDGTFPFWSPDGKSLGFFAGGKLKKIEISGGPPVDLCDASLGLGGSWAPDGTIVFAPNATSPLSRVSASGGQPVKVTSLNAASKEASQDSPQFLPDNRHFLYHSLSTSAEFSGIYLGSLGGGNPMLLLRGISSAAFAPPDHILFLQNGALMVRYFDPNRNEVSGDSLTIARLPGAADVATSLGASPNGILAFLAGTFAPDQQLEWFNRAGEPEGTVGAPGIYYTPRLSPDGGKIAVAIAPPRSPTRDIWIFDQALHNETRLTFDQLHNWTPVWSPDGTKLAYSSNPKESFHIYARPADGSGARQPLLEDDVIEYVDSWSPDGKYIAYARADPKGEPGWDIWALPLFGDRKPFAVVQSQSNKEEPAFSPDGKWLAYDSDESGQWEVYVVSFPHGDVKRQVSQGGGRQPRWRRDGKELFFVATGNRLVAREIRDKGASLDFLATQSLFPIHSGPSPFRSYDATGDGKKFIVVSGGAELNTKGITIMANWPALLERGTKFR
jgi:Tol biopolymer transport system component/predicted Ser/Thr protein kinase